jgi:hypothetical protein
MEKSTNLNQKRVWIWRMNIEFILIIRGSHWIQIAGDCKK